LNSFEDETSAKLGIKECLQHELLIPYPVLAEKAGTLVAQFKFTVMITKGKTTALTGLPLDEALFKTELGIKDQTILDLLAVTNIFYLAINGQGRPKKIKKEGREEIVIYVSKYLRLFIL
jgi:hypothetical protein